MTNPFVANSGWNLDGTPAIGVGGIDFGSMGSWGQPPGVTEEMLRQAQYDNLMAQPGLRQRELDILEQSNQKPSAWTTGAQTFGNIAQGLSGLASIWLGLKGLKHQKEAFKFNKEMANTNMDNSIRDYNRRLSDTLANRALNNGQGQGWVSQQLAQYSAKRSK